jgi:general stress protein YciG
VRHKKIFKSALKQLLNYIFRFACRDCIHHYSLKRTTHITAMIHHVIKHSSRGYIMTQHRGGSGNFADDKQKASDAGKKGGQKSGNGSGGSFKDDPKKASEAGKKGGQSSRKGS